MPGRRRTARQRHPLALTSRKRTRSPVSEPFRTDPFEPRMGDRTAFPVAALLTYSGGHVVENRAVRKQQSILKDHSDTTPLGRDKDAVGTKVRAW